MVSCVAFVVAILAASENFMQMDALNNSAYIYTEITDKPTGKDDYYVFDTNMDFFKEGSRKSVGGNVVMQVEGSRYSTDVAWNTKHLGRRELAISRNIARRNNIGIGDTLWSKNIVSGKTCKYVVRQIIPRVSNIPLINNGNYSNGIIIVGYDNLFSENMRHQVLAYVSDSNNAASVKMIYRHDEIGKNAKMIVPYAGASLVIVIILNALYAVSFKEEIKINFRRRIAIGVGVKRLGRSYIMGLLLYVIPAIVITLILNIIFLLLVGYGRAELVYLFLYVVTQVITLIISFRNIMRKLWRNE